MLYPLSLDVDPFDIGAIPELDLDLVKKYCRIDFEDEDALFEVFAAAAVNWCEAVTKRSVFARSHRWVLRDFNRCAPHEIRLPRGKTQSVESIEYSQGGVITTLRGPSSDESPEPGDYQESLLGDAGGILMPARGSSWPSVDIDVPAPVTITFTAGWESNYIPADLVTAIWFAIADLADHRGQTGFDLGKGGDNLRARMSLVSGYELTRMHW